jgi:hypothetical protein
VGLKRIWAPLNPRAVNGIREVRTDERPRCPFAVPRDVTKRIGGRPIDLEYLRACGALADTEVAGPVDTGVGPVARLRVCARHASVAQAAATSGRALHLVGRLDT